MPKIAVLLAAYNGEKWIEEQLISIFKQKNVIITIYISVDLSTDNTYKIVDELAKTNTSIVVLPYNKRFGSAANNFYYLINNVPIENYEYFALSDQDDIWLENKLSQAIIMLNAYKADGYSSNVMAVWENGKKKLIKKSARQKKYDFIFETPGPGCTFVLKKELLVGLRALFFGNRENLSDLNVHDWLIYAFARTRNYSWIIDKNYYIYYRQHANNQVGANIGHKAFFYRIKLMLSGFGIAQAIKTIEYLKLENDVFIRKWYKSKIKYSILALHANQCRRRKKDQFFFFVLCILLSLKDII
jgi:rhamnosyltransferase